MAAYRNLQLNDLFRECEKETDQCRGMKHVEYVIVRDEDQLEEY